MKKLIVFLVGISIIFFSHLHAQTQELPKPGPEQKLLARLAGVWNYAGNEKENPWGKGGGFVGKTIGRMIANGFVLEQRSTEKSGEYLDLTWYDPATQRYVFQSFDPTGNVSSGSVEMNGNTWTATAIRVDPKGQRVHVRGTFTLSPDGKTISNKQEYSLDEGKTWALWWELTSKKSGK